MDTQQMKCFLTAATCLNFTQAADLLYITQPGLSRRILSLEKELGVQLFVRSNRDVKLTNAGRSLFEDLQHIYSDYERAVNKAIKASKGQTGSLRIGVLDGTYVGDILPNAIAMFTEMYPFVDLSLENYSFNALATLLYEGKLDLALTLYFDILSRQNIAFRIIDKSYDHIAVHRSNPLSEQDKISLADIGDNAFIIISNSDSEKSAQLILDGCRIQGYSPRIKYSPKLQTSMLWVQAGVGVVMLDSRNMLRYDPNVKFLETNQLSDPSLTAAWHQGNTGPFVSIFTELLISAAREK